MLFNTRLPEIKLKEGDKIYTFPEVDLQIVNKSRLEVYVKAPYYHPQVFQSKEDWLLMDLDSIQVVLKNKNANSMVDLISNYLRNCQDEIPCHKKYLNE